MTASPAPPATSLPAMAEALRDMALEAGAKIMKIYEGSIEVRQKEDRSPVTDADEAAEKSFSPACIASAPIFPSLPKRA